MFNKVLIANRGEIAVRIHRACRELGIETVAVYSQADQDALHVKLANEAVCIGPAPAQQSYLNIPAILSAAEVTGADAIHPGYGFLSENAKFAEIVTELGFTFIGPKPEHITLMGDKISALSAAQNFGLPTIPGSNGLLTSLAEAKKIAQKIGFPVIIKAAAGGGGRGMKVAHTETELTEAFHLAQQEAQSAFGDNRVYLEKFLQRPRHIEVQILADSHGNVYTLGERDCSLQRRHQKIFEEAPCPDLPDDERQYLLNLSQQACAKMGYVGAGTLEFLYEDGIFSFIEMNTRVQVEHPVTEMTTGIDIVQAQIRVAAGEKLSWPATSPNLRGHSIEVRINAEDPKTFLPRPGTVTDYYAPSGPGVRVDSALYPGYTVSPHYDPNIAKLIVHAATRAECLAKLRRALEEFIIGGLTTNIPLHQALLADERIITGQYDIHTLTRFLQEQK